MMVLELARCEWIERRENVIALGPSGTGKPHVALGLDLFGGLPKEDARQLRYSSISDPRTDGG